MSRFQVMLAHRAAQRHAPHPAGLQQRSGDDAAQHQPGQRRAGLLDVTAAASRIYSDYYLPFEAYLAAAAIYLACTFCLIGLVQAGRAASPGAYGPAKH
jgi:hypothetical protein